MSKSTNTGGSAVSATTTKAASTITDTNIKIKPKDAKNSITNNKMINYALQQQPPPNLTTITTTTTNNDNLLHLPKYTHHVPYAYHQYPTTLSLIFLLHLLFFYHWNARKKRRDVQGSFDVIIRRRQFHRAFYSAISHPSDDDDVVDDFFRSSSRGDDDERRRHGGRSTRRLLRCPQFLRRYLRPFLRGGSFSGLPLLVYVSHLLWQVRALEPTFYEMDVSYERVLLALSVVSVGLDLGMTLFWLLRCNVVHRYHRLPIATPSSGEMSQSSGGAFASMALENSVAVQSMIDRPICGMTSIVAALLVIYGSTFPHMGLTVLPLFHVWNPEGYLLSGGMGYIAASAVLFLLSRTVHPLGLLTGAMAGVLFELDVVKFLAVESYWSNCLIGTVVVACALSLRGSGRSAAEYGLLPCIDYVSWQSTTNNESRAAAVDSDDEEQQRRNSHVGDEGNAVDDDDDDDGEEGSFLSFDGHAGATEGERLSDRERGDSGSGALRGRHTTVQQNDGGLGGGLGRAHHPRGNLIDP